MSKTPRHADRDLLFQVLGTISMCVLAFVEMAFGQFPVFYGSAPLIMVIGVVILVHYLPDALPLVAVVLAGLVFDLLQGVPPGFTSSLLLLAMIVSLSRRRCWRMPMLERSGMNLPSCWPGGSCIHSAEYILVGAVPAIRPCVSRCDNADLPDTVLGAGSAESAGHCRSVRDADQRKPHTRI